MEQISSEQYELVLKYMQMTSSQNYQEALSIVKTYNFNLQNAMNAKYQNNNINGRDRNRGWGSYDQQQQQQNSQEQDQRLVQKYIQYLYRKNRQSNLFASIFWFFGNIFRGIFLGIAKFTFPQFLKRKTINSNFANLYKTKLNKINRFQDQTLMRTLKNARQIYQKACLLIISRRQSIHECICNALNRRQIAEFINSYFIFAGVVQGDKDFALIPGQAGQKNPPMIVIIRQNIYQQIEVLKKFIGSQQIENITVQKLREGFNSDKNHQKIDRNIGVKYRNHIRRNYYGQYSAFYEQDQEQMIPMSRSHNTRRQQYSQSSSMIKQQNEQYKKMQQQALKRKKQKEQKELRQSQQKRQLQQVLQQRKVRKMSIPDQPQQGQIIRLSFRCPDGSVKNRSFLMNEKIQLIYNWVQTNQEIQFQDNQKRCFELLASYPPTQLSQKKQMLLSEVFDSDQQKVMIRQL